MISCIGVVPSRSFADEVLDRNGSLEQAICGESVVQVQSSDWPSRVLARSSIFLDGFPYHKFRILSGISKNKGDVHNIGKIEAHDVRSS